MVNLSVARRCQARPLFDLFQDKFNPPFRRYILRPGTHVLPFSELRSKVESCFWRRRADRAGRTFPMQQSDRQIFDRLTPERLSLRFERLGNVRGFFWS